jgi:hypothetical protein
MISLIESAGINKIEFKGSNYSIECLEGEPKTKQYYVTMTLDELVKTPNEILQHIDEILETLRIRISELRSADDEYVFIRSFKIQCSIDGDYIDMGTGTSRMSVNDVKLYLDNETESTVLSNGIRSYIDGQLVDRLLSQVEPSLRRTRTTVKAFVLRRKDIEVIDTKIEIDISGDWSMGLSSKVFIKDTPETESDVRDKIKNVLSRYGVDARFQNSEGIWN